MSPFRPRDGPPSSDTTLHVRRAVEGDGLSVEWIVRHFHSMLLESARLRLKPHLRHVVDAEDLVQHVWLITLPKLGDLRAQHGRMTPVLLSYLDSVLVNEYTNRLRRHMRGAQRQRCWQTTPATDQAETKAALDRIIHSEQVRAVQQAIESLPEAARRLLVLRGIDQLPYDILEARLDTKKATLRVQYHRALRLLEQVLPRSILDEMREHDE